MKTQTRSIVYACLALLCLLSLLGCSANNRSLSAKEKESLSAIWSNAGNEPLVWLDDNGEYGAVYYGKYADCHILMVQEPPVVVTVMFHEYVAGRKFDCSRPFALYAIRDDQVYSLKDAYEQGLLTDEHIQEIHEFHTSR